MKSSINISKEQFKKLNCSLLKFIIFIVLESIISIILSFNNTSNSLYREALEMFKLSAQVLFENGKTIKEFLLISNSFIREYATLSLAKEKERHSTFKFKK